ncbi:MAG TPA: DUF6428 family protein [Pirellulaceae bacterium]|nr:DUF6428 family protein [Pirellulaceae bacterium]HMO92809.1 DUF6428 family protein [Pirellulaceae bacterium]HMP69448.1 DUF6428 family protein [Pirellulaceae bacterium]
MNLGELREKLHKSPNQTLRIEIPSGKLLPEHFHVTEVGKVTKDFVDCGGVQRCEQTCVLQTLVANDVDHRLSTSKFSDILEKSSTLELNNTKEVDVEVQGATIEVYRIKSATSSDGQLVLKLQNKQTACLAPNKCGLEIVSSAAQSCCGGHSSCC